MTVPVLGVTSCEIVARGLDHPECVAVGSAGELYAGGEAGQIYRIDRGTSSATVFADTGFESGGHALDSEDNLFECSMAGVVNRIDRFGRVETYSSGTEELPMEVPNYPVFTEDGRLLVSDSGDWGKANGRIYVVHPGGGTALAFPDYLNFPNGMALDSQSGSLYVVQSNVRNIIRLKLSDDGLIGRPEIYVSLPAIGLADGVALAASGNLYVACFEPSAILKVTPDRRVEVVLQDMLLGVFNRPTNVAFDRREAHLYYANYGGAEIGRLPIDEPGMPLAYPNLGLR